ncbi:hypothetical protein HPB50_001387 [Hyalomma asiaticum]|uniref:Uncharacterized protein n=1 Tax=Hyalomma asiaticum TaxID=266040 RepID=A0ACB7SDV5_HYAAI|nr:hypothetical protein HPB50_001387 [Hyalomma asiaticum]
MGNFSQKPFDDVIKWLKTKTFRHVRIVTTLQTTKKKCRFLSIKTQNSSGTAARQGAPTAPQSPSAAAATVASPKPAPTVRLCHIVRRPDFEGYGFKLLEDHDKKLVFISAVESGSPAEAAGLQVKDIIIKVILNSLIS